MLRTGIWVAIDPDMILGKNVQTENETQGFVSETFREEDEHPGTITDIPDIVTGTGIETETGTETGT